MCSVRLCGSCVNTQFAVEGSVVLFARACTWVGGYQCGGVMHWELLYVRTFFSAILATAACSFA